MVKLNEWENQIEELIASKSESEAGRLRQGVEFAKRAHAGDRRKSTNEPYIVHPYEACLVVAEVTDDIDVIIAALLHDVVEDTSYDIEDIRAEFGERITSFVADESEDKLDHLPKDMSWLIRKEKFLEHLKRAPKESKTICLGDKISNLRSMVEQYLIQGDDFWNAFNQKDPRRHAWYYRSIAEAISSDFFNTKVFDEYRELYEVLFKKKICAGKFINGDMKMEVIELRFEDGIVYIKISGRITAANADDMHAGIRDIASKYEGKEIVFDFDELEMISSAGLRVFLKIKKEHLNFRIINASAEVYDVFEMTGLVQLFDISKAYRRMSVDGCSIIGEGAKGIVYKIDEETIIKVYKDPDCMDDIVKERECAKKALVMGVPTAIPFDIVRVGDYLGSVFELVNAKSVTKSVMDNPERAEELIKEYASIMREMHEVIDDGSFGITLPKEKEEIRGWVDFAKDYVDESIYSEMLKFIDEIRDVDVLLHGDGHPNNVMCTRDGMIFIDMDTLSTGDPLIDVAVVYTALIGYKVADPDDKFIPMSLEDTQKIWKIFLGEYCKAETEERITEIEKWCKKFCYLRLYRRGVRKEADRPCFAENSRKALIEAFS